MASNVQRSTDYLGVSPPLEAAATGKGRNHVESLARGLSVMLAFSHRKRQLTPSQISRQLGISRAAVRRSLMTLVDLGFADEYAGQYYLTPKVCSLGQAYLASTPIARVAQPLLESLSGDLCESCSIGALDQFEVFYVARAAVSRIMSVDLQVGSRLPAFCTSMGRVLLASQPPDQLEKYLDKLVITRYTDKTVSSVVKLKQILNLTRRNNYAIVDQELEVAVRSLAVPIRNRSGAVAAALNVGCPAQRISIRDMQTLFLPHLHKVAQEIGARL